MNVTYLYFENGKIPNIHRAGRSQRLSPEQRRQIGMIIKPDYFTTSSELKTMLETKYPGLDVSERTNRQNLDRLLSQQAKANRLTWARKHSHYNWNN